MKVAIYARYSSENQSEKSIDDQIRVCKNYIQTHGMSVEDRHIYIDEAISGAIINRPGLQTLQLAAENKEFEAMLVDDLSRLSRSNHQMLTLVLKFNYLEIKIISVSDGIVTDDDNSKLGIHIRGLMNELYLDDLKKKTIRGLEGQKIRGFSVGENVYGYSSLPVGELKLNRKGQAKYDGKVHKINPEEADIVKRVFNEFIEGKSLIKIVQGLNRDKIPSKRTISGGWNLSSVGRILRNDRYIGKWVWKKSRNVRDPLTGRKKRVPRPEKEWLSDFREDLIIIDKEIWERAQNRWKEINGTWPVRKDIKNRNVKQQSYVHGSPLHLLSGLMKCHCCGGAILLLSGKGNGYYGCGNSKRKNCTNTLLVPRKLIEKIIISELQGRILTIDNLRYVYEKVEKLAASGMNDVPEQIKKKKILYDKILHEVQNYLNYVKMGNFSRAVSEALKDAETRGENLKEEMMSLEFQERNTFKAPPREWIKDRLENLHKTLDEDTQSSSMALKALLGAIRLEPVSADSHFHVIDKGGIYRGRRNGSDESDPYFKPYYVAHTQIKTLALLDDRDKGSNWSGWWR